MKSNRARLADATMNAAVRECEGDPITQAGLEGLQFSLAVQRAPLTSSCRAVQNVRISISVLFSSLETGPVAQP